MKERPILFSGAMVRAILEGRKTQTRRPLVPRCECGEFNPEEMSATSAEGFQTGKHSGRWWCACCTHGEVNCRYGRPGDRLWVRETWREAESHTWAGTCCKEAVHYRADEDEPPAPGQWKPSIFMPRWASRILLEVTDVRVQRVQEITPVDALAEGITCDMHNGGLGHPCDEIRMMQAFRELWDPINSKRGFGWDDNPWVWAITFRRIEP